MKKEANPCHNTGVYHVTSQKITDAMEALLKEDNVAAKNALESYLYDYGTEDSTTDQKQKQESLIFQRQIRTAIPMRRLAAWLIPVCGDRGSRTGSRDR